MLLNGISTPKQIVNLTGLVPYTGATSNVNLGAHTLTAQSVTETTPTLLKLDQTTPQTFTAGVVTGTGLLKVTAGLLGLDTNTYLTTELDPVFSAWKLATPPLYPNGDGSGLSGVLHSYIETDTLNSVLSRGNTSLSAITAGGIRSGSIGVTGQFSMYSHISAGVDWISSINPNLAQSANADFYLPASQPAGTYLLNMTPAGVIGFDTNSYVTGTPWTGMGYITSSALSGLVPYTGSNSAVALGAYDFSVNTTTIVTNIATGALSFGQAAVAGNINFWGLPSTVGGIDGSINFRPNANGQILFDGQSRPADPSNFNVQNREAHKNYYGLSGTFGTIPANMGLTNVYNYTELWCNPYSGTQTSLTLYGQYVNNTWRSPVAFTTGKSGNGVSLIGSFFTSSFNADVTFTHNNIGKIMNTYCIGAQYQAGSQANLTQTAGTLNSYVIGLKVNHFTSGTLTFTGSPNLYMTGLQVTSSMQSTTGGTPTKSEITGQFIHSTLGTLNLLTDDGTTRTGIKIPSITGGSTNWAVASDGGNSYHVGNMRFGGSTAPTYAIDVTGDINASGIFRAGGVAGINAIVSYVDTLLGAKTLTFVAGILTAQV